MLTQDELKATFRYDPKSGAWIRLLATSARVKVGDVASCYNRDGYLVIMLNRKLYRACRLAFLYMTGEWPEVHVDHIDGNRRNDRWANLRLATRSQNQSNRAKQSNNSSGFKGVYFHPQSRKWRARITFGGVSKSLGLFNSPQEANEAYCAAARDTHKEFARSD